MSLRLNPIAAFHDYTHKKRIKEALLAQLRKVPPGTGVEVERGLVAAAAVVELCREHPELVFTKWRDGFMLTRRVEFDENLTDVAKKGLRNTNTLINPGDNADDL